HPFVGMAAVERLVAAGAAVVGIDSVNIDDTRTGERPVHTALLGAGIPIVEHLRGLDALSGTTFTFTAVPPAVVGMGTFPVRALARIVGGYAARRRPRRGGRRRSPRVRPRCGCRRAGGRPRMRRSTPHR